MTTPSQLPDSLAPSQATPPLHQLSALSSLLLPALLPSPSRTGFAIPLPLPAGSSLATPLALPAANALPARRSCPPSLPSLLSAPPPISRSLSLRPLSAALHIAHLLHSSPASATPCD